MKIIVIGDLHGRDIWKTILEKESDFDKIVFIGDYFDTHDDISAATQIHNFKEIIDYKKNSNKKVIVLIGNHDFNYFNGCYDPAIKGVQMGAMSAITYELELNKSLMTMAYKMGNILFTHAGVSKTFLTQNNWDEKQPIDEFINDLWKYTPRVFFFNGWNNIGDDKTQTPIWIRPRSLMKDSKSLGLIQVVGHTFSNCIDIKGKATGGKYYFIDTLGTSKEYMIINTYDDRPPQFSCKKAI